MFLLFTLTCLQNQMFNTDVGMLSCKIYEHSVTGRKSWRREEGVVSTCHIQYNKFLPCGSSDRLDHLEEGVHWQICVALNSVWCCWISVARHITTKHSRRHWLKPAAVNLSCIVHLTRSCDWLSCTTYIGPIRLPHSEQFLPWDQ